METDSDDKKLVKEGKRHGGIPSSGSKATPELSAAPLFTPGPWAVEDRRRAPLPNVRIVDASNNEVAQVSDIHMRDHQSPHPWTHEQANILDARGLSKRSPDSRCSRVVHRAEENLLRQRGGLRLRV